MTNEFTVIGEDPDDDHQLLLAGADGQYYEYLLERDRVVRLEPDSWWVSRVAGTSPLADICPGGVDTLGVHGLRQRGAGASDRPDSPEAPAGWLHRVTAFWKRVQ